MKIAVVAIVSSSLLGISTAAENYPSISDDVFVASEECPCINPWESYNITFQQGNCPEGRYELYSVIYKAMKCVSPEYGVNYCNEWDLDDSSLDDICKVEDDVPDWCLQKWCYVDTATCQRPNQKTQFKASEDDDNVFPFSYSFQTCGYEDRYDYTLLLEPITGQMLRISYPDDSADGYSLVSKNSDGFKGGAQEDIRIRMFNQYNISYTINTISEKSKTKLANFSSYDQCVYDVMLGETDICIGNFAVTKRRLELASFPTTLGEEIIRLVTFTNVDDNLIEFLLTPLKPFTYRAWGWLWLNKYLVSCSSQSNKLSVKAKSKKIVESIFENIYVGSRSFSEGGVVSESDDPSVEEKLIICGFSVFALIILTAYTATSAAALVIDSDKYEFHSMAEVEAANVNICVPEVYKNTFIGLYPLLEKNIVITKKTNAVFESMDNEMCRVAIATQDAYNKRIASSSNDCDKVLTETIYVYGTTWAVTDNLREAISYVFTEYNQQGVVDNAIQDNKDLYIDESKCKGSASDQYEENFLQLDVKNLLAPLLITSLSTSLALVMLVYKHFKNRNYARPEVKEGIDEKDEKLSPVSSFTEDEIKKILAANDLLSSVLERNLKHQSVEANHYTIENE